ncbi:hypothetical protein JJE68_01518 [Pediococcus acidilactici]|nr:hypothetical protein JJE68_01518 [Pediococcus acidilactici]
MRQRSARINRNAGLIALLAIEPVFWLTGESWGYGAHFGYAAGKRGNDPMAKTCCVKCLLTELLKLKGSLFFDYLLC